MAVSGYGTFSVKRRIWKSFGGREEGENKRFSFALQRWTKLPVLIILTFKRISKT